MLRVSVPEASAAGLSPALPPSPSAERPRSLAKRVWREWLLGAVLPVWLVITFGFTFARVDGDSMNPTLRSGDVALLLKYPRWLHAWGLDAWGLGAWSLGASGLDARGMEIRYPRRGAIVVFRIPASSDYAYQTLPLGLRYRPYNIKRVIGIPGDTVGISGGRVRVNGKAIAEPYTAAATDRPEPSVTLKAGQIYVLGDNRLVGESVDSRYYGPVELSDVAGPVSWHIGVGRRGSE